tara:strand:+ start:2560 stop:4623 length:2064 start_codon:yes stop_codon:yes gene_type:complete
MIIEIPIFDGGLLTNVDPEDIPPNATSETENFDVDVLGKLIKRKGLESKGTLNGTHLTQLFYWVDSNLTGGANWIGFEDQSNEIIKFNKDFSNKAVLHTFSSNPPSDIQIIPMANSLRFANGHDQNVGFLQYIDREFFFGGYTHDALKYDSASPSYPTTWSLNKEGTATGSLATGTYYYKVVPVFDGNQEVQLQDQFIKQAVSGNDDSIEFSITVDTDDYNPRITGANVYRHFSADDTLTPVYRLVKSINLSTKSTSTDKTAGNSTSRIGNIAYAHAGGISNAISTVYASVTSGDKSQGVVSVNIGGVSKDLKGHGVSGSDSDHFTDNVIYLPSNVSSNGWDVSISIQGTYLDGNGSQQTSGGVSVNGVRFGKNMVYDTRTSNNWNFSVGEKIGWIQKIGTQFLTVTKSLGRAIELNADSTALGSNVTIAEMTNGYRFESLSGNQFKIHVVDNGLTNDRTHPLTTTKNKVNYKHGAFVNGRFFAGNVNLDPDDEAEKHDDFIIFSPINQPDILPVSNFIQIKDSQGGEIMGMRRLNDNLVVLMERGVYQLFAPSGNPASYSLREADANIGCIARNSIVEAGQYLFFAGTDNIYMTGAGMSSAPVTTAIKDIYTGSTNLNQTIGIYDPLKNRVLFRFGSDGTKIYALDYLKIASGQESWNKLTFASAKSVDLLSIDADLKVYTTHNES